jgi:head-tail adaptor
MNNGPFNLKPIGEFYGENHEISWLVENLLFKGGLSLVAGSPKSGKSTLTRQLALDVSRGELFLERKTLKGLVMYFAFEEHPALVSTQMKKQGFEADDEILIHIGPHHSRLPVSDIEKIIQTEAPVLAVLDTLSLFQEVQDSNDYTQVNEMMKKLREVARNTGCHVMCTHHQNKGNGSGANKILGSTAYHGAVDTALIFNRSNNGKSLLSTSQRGGIPFDGTELIFDGETESFSLGAQIQRLSNAQSKAMAIREELLKSGEEMSQGEIREKVKGKSEDISEAFKILRSCDDINVNGVGSPNDPYKYSSFDLDVLVSEDSLIPPPIEGNEGNNDEFDCYDSTEEEDDSLDFEDINSGGSNEI